jgi:hypothetical protein
MIYFNNFFASFESSELFKDAQSNGLNKSSSNPIGKYFIYKNI